MGRTNAEGRDLDRIPGVSERPDPPFPQLLQACTVSAMHLEMRDVYTPEDLWFKAWLAGDREEFDRRVSRPWLDLIRQTTDRGVVVRRVRVVSEPVTDYIRFEYDTTDSNTVAGEQVRWLPRHLATGLLLPANDCWILDGRRVQFNYFSGPGEFLNTRLCDDSAIVDDCARAFDGAWDRAIAHQDYRPR